MGIPNFLIYGATGYTGRLIVEHALARGLTPVIAGRDQRVIASMAAACGLEWRAAPLHEPGRLRAILEPTTVLLNAAGPFSTTAAPLLDACVAAGTHYLDITGEAGSIEATARWHDAAVRRGVMLMPAVGYEVVASDCLAAHVARRLPGARTLKLGWAQSETISRGSVNTCLEVMSHGVLVRREGRLVTVAPGSLAYDFDYGRGPQHSVAASLGDVSAAFFSTGIPNVEAYMRATLPVWGAVTASRYWGWLLSVPPWQAFLRAQTAWLAAGPSHQERVAGWATLVAEAKDTGGGCVRSRLHTGDVYAFTALSAVAVAERTLAGELTPGFQTPSRVFGPDFALSFGGAVREDI